MHPAPPFTVEKLNDYRGHCDCCGHESRTVLGFLYRGEEPVGSYSVNWTVDHLYDLGANIDLVLGEWGDEHGPEARYAVATMFRIMEDGSPSLMVVDAAGRPAANGRLASTALRREDVIGTPLAPQVFALTDAILMGDDRLFG